ncbi:hypothetical protein WICMUC_001290 [Wickerhamomyces mucosus]|uniref:3,4-dihydroxy-2-butanone 4-phosphate synthase n=1 Tax=Wickerhamomyces mucosus TaxID=1378264 RepID=A0A9P8PXL3_9ASCO|nr:hypothetical protein WICMUC_001290 [Wickerhamomyces mucosus]
MSVLTPIPEALEAFAKNEFLIVMDDESRENEGDLIIAGQSITSKQMAFLIKHSSGYICAPITNKKADELNLPLMSNLNTENTEDRHGTAYTVTIDVKEGTTTGISASDRANTLKALSNPNAKSSDFLKPGHIVPLRAKDGLLKERRGHTEAGVHLARLTGLQEVVAIGELVNDNEEGDMMRLDDCIEFSKKYDIKIISIEQLLQYINENNL